METRKGSYEPQATRSNTSGLLSDTFPGDERALAAPMPSVATHRAAVGCAGTMPRAGARCGLGFHMSRGKSRHAREIRRRASRNVLLRARVGRGQRADRASEVGGLAGSVRSSWREGAFAVAGSCTRSLGDQALRELRELASVFTSLRTSARRRSRKSRPTRSSPPRSCIEDHDSRASAASRQEVATRAARIATITSYTTLPT